MYKIVVLFYFVPKLIANSDYTLILIFIFNTNSIMIYFVFDYMRRRREWGPQESNLVVRPEIHLYFHYFSASNVNINFSLHFFIFLIVYIFHSITYSNSGIMKHKRVLWNFTQKLSN